MKNFERKKFDKKNNSKKFEEKKEAKEFEKSYDDQIEGRNAVLELLESNKDINKIYIQAGERKGSINKIIAMAKEKRVVIVEKDKILLKIIIYTKHSIFL